MSFIGTVSYRHLRSPTSKSFTSFASLLSVIGLAIGIAALIITMSILNGFEKTLSQKLVSFDGHIQIQHILGYPIPANLDSLNHYLTSHSTDLRAVPYVRKPVIIRSGQRIQSILLEGIPEHDVSYKMEPLIKFGSFYLGDDHCLMGKRLADELDVSVGDKIVFTQMGAYTSKMDGSQIKQMTIGGLFQSGITEYDRSMVYISLKDSEEFLSMNGQISGISIHLNDNKNIHHVTDDLFQILGYPYFVTTWKEKHSNLYEWMSVQQWPILIIFSMIALVGIINIISAISMIILEKIKEIGLLKALGCTRKQIRTIFMVDGTIIGTVGTIIGGITAISLIWIQAEYQLISIPEDVYFMDQIPVIISWEYFILIFFLSILIAIIASILPTSYAGKIKPAEAVRYE